MLLTLHNLPPNMRYQDVKSLIQSKCGSMELILDNLVQHNKYKKVTIGLADDGDAAIFVRKMNGLYVDGCQLYVEDSRHKMGVEQPYRSTHLDQQASEVPGMVTSGLQHSGMPQMMSLDSNMGAVPYGMYMMNQNAAMGYNQQLMPVLSTGQFSMVPQGSFVNNANQAYSEQWDQNNTSCSNEPHRMQDNWEIDPSSKQSRWDVTSGKLNEQRGKSPNQNKNISRYDSRNPPESRSIDNSQNPVENVSYPLHLYSRQDLISNIGPNSRPDKNPYFHQNLQTNRSREISDSSSNICQEPSRAYSSFGQDPPLGFDPAPKKRSRFDEKPRVRSRMDQESSRRPGFDREPPKRRSDFDQEPPRGRSDFGQQSSKVGNNPRRDHLGFGQENIRERSRTGQEPSLSFDRAPKRRSRIDEDQPEGRSRFDQASHVPSYDKDLPNKRVRTRRKSRPAYDQNTNSSNSDNRSGWQPGPSKYRYIKNTDSNVTAKPSQSLQGLEAEGNIKHWNQPSMRDSQGASGRSNLHLQRNKSTLPIGNLKKSRPNSDDFLPIGGVTKHPGSSAPRLQTPKGPNLAQKTVPKNQPSVSESNAPRPNLEEADDIPPDVKQAMKVHDNTIFQSSAVLAREIIRKLRLTMKESRVVLKPLKKAIRARFEVLLGETLCNYQTKIIDMYRSTYPECDDHAFFEAVLQKIEKGEDKKETSKDADPELKTSLDANVATTSAPTPNKRPLPADVSERRTQIMAKLSNLTVTDGKIPKYPNADKQLMKQQKQLGKQEYYDEDFTELPDMTKRVLEKELDDLCAIYNTECMNTESQLEKLVADNVIIKSLPDFRRSLKTNAAKRILNLYTNLGVRIYFFGKQPSLTALNEFLMNYGVISCRKSVKAPNFIAMLNSYDGYDSLLAMNSAVVDGTNITIKPLQITGFKPRPIVAKKKTRIATGGSLEIIVNNQSSTFNVPKGVKQETEISEQKDVKEITTNDNEDDKNTEAFDTDVKQDTANDNIDNQETKNEDFSEDFCDADIGDLAEDDLEDY